MMNKLFEEQMQNETLKRRDGMMNKVFEEQMQNETLKRRGGMMNKVRTPAPFGFFDLCDAGGISAIDGAA